MSGLGDFPGGSNFVVVDVEPLTDEFQIPRRNIAADHTTIVDRNPGDPIYLTETTTPVAVRGVDVRRVMVREDRDRDPEEVSEFRHR